MDKNIILKNIQNFFEKPSSSKPLAVFRILVGAFSTLNALILYPDLENFIGDAGWLKWVISKAHAQPWQIHVSDIYHFLSFTSVSTETVSLGLWLIYFVASICLMLGAFGKITAVMTWLSFYIIFNSMLSFSYGVDIFLNIVLFYQIFMPTFQYYSIDSFFSKSKPPLSYKSTLAIRTLQIHICIVYLSAGGEKALMSNWWDGSYMWCILTDPTIFTGHFTALADYPIFLKSLGWSTIILELGYVIAMWIPKLRVIWLLAIIGMHVFIGVFMSMPMFGLVMILFSLSAWGADCLLDIQSILRKKNSLQIKINSENERVYVF